MPDKNLTDNEIINLLKCCSKSTCSDCGYSKECDGYSSVNYALDLINRLQAEVEELNTFAEIKKEEIAKLITKTKAEAYKEFLPLLENFRNEVVDKFIIMCDGNDYNKLNLMSMVDTIDCIYDKHCDNLLKELVGEDNE